MAGNARPRRGLEQGIQGFGLRPVDCSKFDTGRRYHRRGRRGVDTDIGPVVTGPREEFVKVHGVRYRIR